MWQEAWSHYPLLSWMFQQTQLGQRKVAKPILAMTWSMRRSTFPNLDGESELRHACKVAIR